MGLKHVRIVQLGYRKNLPDVGGASYCLLF